MILGVDGIADFNAREQRQKPPCKAQNDLSQPIIGELAAKLMQAAIDGADGAELAAFL